MSKVEIFTSHKGGTSQTVTYKGADAQPLGEGWLVFNNTGDLGTIVITQDALTEVGHGYGFSAIKVDGKILVDHSSIGVDMSGNNNNFHDQNFGIGDSSQVWSKGATGPFSRSSCFSSI